MLAAMLASFDRVIESVRAQAQASSVNIFDQHKVNSFIPKRSSSRPLLMKLQERTYHKYKRVWKQLLCFAYRVLRLHQGRELHYIATEEQILRLDKLVSASSAYNEAASQPKSSSSSTTTSTGDKYSEQSVQDAADRLDDSCTRFCISLLDQTLNGNVYDSLLVVFTAVLGIDRDRDGQVTAQQWRRPEQYTSDLSAMIKMAQILVLARAALGAACGEAEFPASLVDQMQEQFMVFGTRSPMTWMLKIRSYGAAVRDSTTANGYIAWSDDGRVVKYKAVRLQLLDLQYFVQDQVAAAHTELRDLLLLSQDELLDGSTAPRFVLHDLQDNPAASAPGWSFLADERNAQLQAGKDWLLRRVATQKRVPEEIPRLQSRREHSLEQRGRRRLLKRAVCLSSAHAAAHSPYQRPASARHRACHPAVAEQRKRRSAECVRRKRADQHCDYMHKGL